MFSHNIHRIDGYISTTFNQQKWGSRPKEIQNLLKVVEFIGGNYH